MPKLYATANNDVGEQASLRQSGQALAKVRFHEFEPRFEFSNRDLFIYELSGSVDAAERRDKIGAILGIGYANAKQFLVRLNNYGVTRARFLARSCANRSINGTTGYCEKGSHSTYSENVQFAC